MIIIKKNEEDPSTMCITLEGDGETVAQEYVALTLKLHDTFPAVLDRAECYLSDIIELRKELNND